MLSEEWVMDGRRPRVVIVGGGFGGLNAARALDGAAVDVTLVDRRNHHLFQPLLYQVATAALSPADIASPIRGVLRKQRNADVVMAEVVGLEAGSRQVVMADGSRLSYDYLIIAAGAVDQYFGHSEWADLAPGLKSIEDATEIRRRFLLAFEAAERESDPDVRRSLLTTVVIGAGPTGVEMAGAMAEMARHSLIKDFRRIDPSTANIVLVEGGDRILPAYPPRLSARAEAALRQRGVEIRKGTLVSRIEPDAVYVGEEKIETRNVVWAAGIAAAPVGALVGAELDEMGRVIVEPDLSIDGHPEIFVVGDLANAKGRDGEPLPGLAPVAIQQGKWVGENILRSVRGEKSAAFRYRDRGTMATIGRGDAIAEVWRLKLHGPIAWLAWIFIHVFFLIGFRNRVAVMLEWAWSYISWQRGARLITGPVGSRLAPRGSALGEPHGRETPEKEDAIAVTEQPPANRQRDEKGWVSGDSDQNRD
ncbi:MAG: NAD(P)/FAD-dependent oxidoreductase [Gemmatimonadota bacterium]